jgi:hypothetical protein
MKKIFLLAALTHLCCTALYANDDDLIVTQSDGSHFQRDDIFQTMARGEGKCTVTGNRNWSGGCGFEQSLKGGLDRFDIYLNDEKTHFRVEQLDDGSKHFVTAVDGKDVVTTIEDISDKESILTIGDIKVHTMMNTLELREDTPESRARFASDDEYLIMVRGEGSCELSGSRSFKGGCGVEQMTKGLLNLYDIYLNDEKTHFQVKQRNDGTKRYVTHVDGKDVNTTIEDLSKKESIITMGDLKLRIILKKLVVRSGP